MVNSWDFYSYRVIRKLTAFLQLQDLRLRNMTVTTSSNSSTGCSLHRPKTGLLFIVYQVMNR